MLAQARVGEVLGWTCRVSGIPACPGWGEHLQSARLGGSGL